MLIVPLHRPLTRATFPIVTALLILVNMAVFVRQMGDQAAMEAAQEYHLSSGLADIEFPAYERHLERTGQHEARQALRAMDAGEQREFAARETVADVRFEQALRDGGLFERPEDLERWRPLRARYDGMQQDVFTLRHLLRSNEIDAWRMFASTFLHGDLMHLVGNMVFLLALGLLVEGALGPARFVAVYLLGAFGSSAISLAWRWGEAGGGLGASGAIAALMGAFCVVWGRQPVRFFYWFGVVFDYVRAPAIWLLPAWLGWEVYNLAVNADAGIGFDAHAGGIVTGALTGAVLVATKQVRASFIQGLPDTVPAESRWERAQALLGRMRLREAESLLAELVTESPCRTELRVARYRVASNAGDRDAQRMRAEELFAIEPEDGEALEAQAAIAGELDMAGIHWTVEARTTLIGRCIAAHLLGPAEALLGALPAGNAGGEQAQLWFRLALTHGEHDGAARSRALRALVERHPDQPQAHKARFLLENA